MFKGKYLYRLIKKNGKGEIVRGYPVVNDNGELELITSHNRDYSTSITVKPEEIEPVPAMIVPYPDNPLTEGGICPSCSGFVNETDADGNTNGYCYFCGQRLKWTYSLEDCGIIKDCPQNGAGDYNLMCYGNVIPIADCEQCGKQYRCSTYAWADDEIKLLEGEAYKCPDCGVINTYGSVCRCK